MANKSLFASQKAALRTDTVNYSGGAAYKLSDRQTLAQLAATGCLNQTFYASAETQLEDLLAAAASVEPEFLAKTAIYARQRGHMKDTPAVLLAALAAISPEHLSKAFPRVITNGRMVRNFVQVIRSGATGRKSLGSRPKALIQFWLNRVPDQVLLRASIGQSPSIADVIKMVHPKPVDAKREALFAWLIGKPCDIKLLPENVQQYLAFRECPKGSALPDVPFQMLTALPLTKKHWAKVSERGGWQMVRMNLNTFMRHGVTDMRASRIRIAKRLVNHDEISKARVFPYQLMAAWKNIDSRMPMEIQDALAEAMEIAIANVPDLPGKVVVCPDVSGSMTSPVTGYREGATSKVSCMDVAALVAASVLRKNPRSRVIPFDTVAREVKISPADRVVDNAAKLSSFFGGGTACSAPLIKLNKEGAHADLVILVSDNESWADRASSYRGWGTSVMTGNGTSVMSEWTKLKKRCPRAKLVCLDIAPYATTQAVEGPDVLNIGGFSDTVFEVIAAFAAGRLGPNHWVGEIDMIEL